jgi:hypothetical protein
MTGTALTFQFPPRLAAGKRTYIWQWTKFEQLTALVVESRMGIRILGVLMPAAARGSERPPESVFVPELNRALPVLTIDDARTSHGDDYQVLYNLQSFFEIFRLIHGQADRSLMKSLRLVNVTEQSNPLFMGPPQIMTTIWDIFQNRSIPLARRMLDTLLELMGEFFDSDAQRLISFVRTHPQHFFAGRMATIDLATGNFARGWFLMESYYQDLIKAQCPPLPHPFWNGEDFKGRTVIFRRERTPSDQILYVNALDELIDHGCHVIVECEKRLVALFKRSFPRLEVIPRLDPPHPRALTPEIGFQASYSAPFGVLRDRLDKYPRHKGYLKANLDRVTHWRDETRRIAPAGLRVGLAWRGRRGSAVTADISQIPDWESMLRVPGVTFFRLQYDECADELAYAKEHFGCTVEVLEGIDLFNELDELAALIASLDLVVSTSGINMHMAGAIGTPSFEIMPQYSHQFLGQDFDVFYPSARVFTRDSGRPVREAIDKAAAALAELARQGMAGSAILDTS